MPFAIEPRDFEKHIFLRSDGDVHDQATEDDFHYFKDVCSTHGSHVAIVIDAEGEFVCLAPVAVARLIARLLDDCGEFGDDMDAVDGADAEGDAAMSERRGLYRKAQPREVPLVSIENVLRHQQKLVAAEVPTRLLTFPFATAPRVDSLPMPRVRTPKAKNAKKAKPPLFDNMTAAAKAMARIGLIYDTKPRGRPPTGKTPAKVRSAKSKA